MKQRTNLEISELCRELSLLVHAGVGVGDGLYLLAEEERNGARRTFLTGLAETVENGAFLSDALQKAGGFPQYVTGLLHVGEQTGRTEETLRALAHYYEEREQTDSLMRSTLTYPVILMLLMLVVVVVLLGKVLPVFNAIYESLGGQLTGIAGALLRVGRVIDAGMPILCAVLAAVMLFFLCFSAHGGFRAWILRAWRKRRGDRGLGKMRNNAQYAAALSMGFASGLMIEDAMELAGVLLQEIPAAARRARSCAQMLRAGESLADALGNSELMAQSACRLLSLGLRGGAGDAVMEEIARRMQEDVRAATERRLAEIEPTLVLVMSALVGVILLSVMLPLLNIMAALG